MIHCQNTFVIVVGIGTFVPMSCSRYNAQTIDFLFRFDRRASKLETSTPYCTSTDQSYEREDYHRAFISESFGIISQFHAVLETELCREQP